MKLHTTILCKTSVYILHRNALHSHPGVNPLAIAEIESLPAAVDGYVTVDEMKSKILFYNWIKLLIFRNIV